MMQAGLKSADSRIDLPRRGDGRRQSLQVLLMGSALLVLAAMGSFAGKRQLDKFLGQLDGDALRTAKRALDRSLEQDGREVLAQVGVLAEDSRIRATVVMADPDEATIRDVLQDLKVTSHANLLAVLDVTGKVRSVVGIDGLREVDLGHSAVVKAADEHPAVHTWTFPQEVLTVGVAPIRSRGQLYAFLVLGLASTREMLNAAVTSTGVSSAVLIGDKLVASSTDDPAQLQALRVAAAGDDDKDLEKDPIFRNGQDFLGRVTRIDESVGAAKVVSIVPRHHDTRRVRLLMLSIWTSTLASFVIFALLLLSSRRPNERAL